MATRNRIIDDVELRLTRGHLTDDLLLTRAQVSHWVDLARDEFVADYLESRMKKGRGADPYYIESEQCLVVAGEDPACETNCYDRYFTTITENVLSFGINDDGMVRVTTSDGLRIEKVNRFELDIIRDMEFSKPSSDKPVFYREGKKIFILGVSGFKLTTFKIHVYYVETMDSHTTIVDTTDPYSVNGRHIGAVTELAVKIGLQQMGLKELEDNINEGVQE